MDRPGLKFCFPRPAFAAWMIFGLGLCFFLAAANTLSGWLYVLSALMLGVSAAGFYLPGRQLKALRPKRTESVVSMHAGEARAVLLQITNTSRANLAGFIAIDRRPTALGGRVEQSLEGLKAHSGQGWASPLPALRRGVYCWEEASIATAAPLGLIWRERVYSCPLKVVVYPRLIELGRCPLIEDTAGRGGSEALHSYTASIDGLTRTIRPYRQGDPLRAVHWRTSARRGEWQTREFEQERAPQTVLIAIDCRADYWTEAEFEYAIEAALALYAFASGRGYPAVIWTGSESLAERTQVLEYLACLQPDPATPEPQPEIAGALWLTARPLVDGCRSVRIGSGAVAGERSLDVHRPLREQLEVLL